MHCEMSAQLTGSPSDCGTLWGSGQARGKWPCVASTRPQQIQSELPPEDLGARSIARGQFLPQAGITTHELRSRDNLSRHSV